MICNNPKCLKEFDQVKYNQKYCSPSCGAKYRISNWVNKHDSKCPVCGKHIYYKSKLCTICSPVTRRKIDDTEILSDIVYTKHHKSSAFALVRSRARAVGKIIGYDRCIVCGYSKHIEICHRKPIHKFNSNSKLSDINNIDNLIALCPNCHWEFDHGLLPDI